MNRKTTLGLILSAVALGAVGLPAMLGATFSIKKAAVPDGFLMRVPAPETENATSGQMRLIAKDGFLYEDFENMRPGKLDSGWTAIATPGHPSDCWSVATLGKGEETVPGTSGTQYAYILGNRDTSDPYSHDAWLFSPAVSLKAGQECKIEFFSNMAMSYGVPEQLDVAVMNAADPDAVVEVLDYIEDNSGTWQYHVYEWTPDEDGEYLLGFHSSSPCMSNATMIDDVRISCAPMSSFVGFEGVDMGDTDLVAGTFKGEYVIQNQGDAPLTVDLASADPEISVPELPVTIPAYSFKRIQVEFTPTRLGQYIGRFLLATNDPSHPEVGLLVVSNVKDVPVTGYHVEDFEAGGPKGWSMNFGAVNTDFKGGHEGPRSFYVRSFYTLDEDTEVGFTTHYYDMGSDPELSLWYKLTDCDLMGVESGPTGPESPILELYVSDDMGSTWKQVYAIKPGTETEHKPSSEFQQLKVDLASYAGKRCRLRTILKHAGNPLENDFILLIDDVAMGTQPEVDLKATALHGKGDVTVGQEYPVDVTVTNLGAAQSGSYRINLTDSNGSLYASAEFPSLDSGKSISHSLNWTPEAAGCIDLKATVVSDNDTITRNDVSNLLHTSATGPENSYISVGQGTMYLSNNSPVYFSAKETLVQTLYYANELGIDAGEINSVTFFSVFDNPYLSEDFDVYIAETDREDLDDMEIIPEALFTKVFSGNVHMPVGEFEFTVPFDRPYSYKGGNIVVMTRKCTDEYLNTKRFIVYEDSKARSITASATVPGTLASNGYKDREKSNFYAKIGFNLTKAPAGSVAGTIRDLEGNVIADAKVALEGTRLYTHSDRKGRYSLPEIGAGTRCLAISKYGFYPYVDDSVLIEEAKATALDFTLTPYPRVSLRGKVTSSDGTPVAEAKVVLEGYASYSALTDENGTYEITGVIGDTGEAYDLRVEALHFQTLWNHEYAVGPHDITSDFTLDADIQPAFNVNANVQDDELTLSWDAPLAEFRHDNGVPATFLGWSHGHARSGIFSTYRQKMLVKQIRFYLSDTDGPHSNINVFLVELNGEGYPDAYKMRYLKQDVPFTDNAWNTVTLETPVEMENFAVGISGNGYIGLGASESDTDHPFEPLMHFWAADDMYNPYDFNDFSVWSPTHPMLRVCGDYMGNPAKDPLHESLTPRKASRPATIYEVYRNALDNPADGRQYIGSTNELSFSDDMYPSLEAEKRYQYSVVATYGGREATESLSNIVKKETSSVDALPECGSAISSEPIGDLLEVSGPELIREIRFLSLDGINVRTITEISSSIDVSDVQPGIYIFTVIRHDGASISKKTIKL